MTIDLNTGVNIAVIVIFLAGIVNIHVKIARLETHIQHILAILGHRNTDTGDTHCD